MKTVLTTTLLISALTATAPAIAGENNWQGKKAKAHSEQHEKHYYNQYERDYKKGYTNKFKHGRENKHAHRDVIRLDIPVAIRGDDRVHLRRLVNRHSNLNLNNYRLKKVVVNNYARRSAAAKLIVGDRVSSVQWLQRGRNHIAAPRRSDGRWVLGVKDARIDNIRVVLEPKLYMASRPGKYQQPWFSNRRNWNDIWTHNQRG
ncbi:MAG: hypothetical protein V2I41_11555, partial [Pseudomonadales bacterium]|nr:hypothetical protein [Pseudomonadales bacterium]